jgi:4-hydroxy-tetrahydrodipicolinate synthase
MFEGVGVALVTPFKKDKSIDYTALGKIIDHIIVGGADYLVALGTTAETPTLSAAEKLSILQFVIQHNAKRLPVVVGIGDYNTQSLLQTLAAYSMEQVSGILSVVPYYNKPSQEGIYQHFKSLTEATDKPIILYNVPGRTVTNMLPATVVRLAHDFKNIVAIKEASGSLPQCMELVAHLPVNFSVLSGDDNLILAQIAVGMKGIISVAANAYTKDFCTTVQQALKHDFAEAQKSFYTLLPKIDLLFAEGNPTGVKYELYRLGLCENELRLPLVAASAQLMQQFNVYQA